jgi:PadR family transcriptional regulator PadR
VNYGSLYPALRRREARGLVKGSWGACENNRRARSYDLTAAGRRQLGVERATGERFSQALGLMLASRSQRLVNMKTFDPRRAARVNLMETLRPD